MTFKEQIEATAAGEDIEAIVIGTFGWGRDTAGDEDAFGFDRNASRKPIPQELKYKVVKWDDVKDFLHYTYDASFGSPECHAITAWTASYVIQVAEYDGSTYLYTTPRNPVDHIPTMHGG